MLQPARGARGAPCCEVAPICSATPCCPEAASSATRRSTRSGASMRLGVSFVARQRAWRRTSGSKCDARTVSSHAEDSRTAAASGCRENEGREREREKARGKERQAHVVGERAVVVLGERCSPSPHPHRKRLISSPQGRPQRVANRDASGCCRLHSRGRSQGEGTAEA